MICDSADNLIKIATDSQSDYTYNNNYVYEQNFSKSVYNLYHYAIKLSLNILKYIIFHLNWD